MKKLSILSLCLMMALAVGSAMADELTFSGTSTGTFTSSGTTVAGPVSYTSGTFAGTTAFGLASMNILGKITVATGSTISTGDVLNLVVTFTLPTGISSGNPIAVPVSMLVAVDGNTGLVHLFGSCCYGAAFSNSSQTGTFSFGVNSLDIRPGQTQNITGFLLAEVTNTVPEPASMVLLGSGMLGLGSFVRRKLAI